jgi:hypothetical protein
VNIRRSIIAACIVGLANALTPSGSGDDGGVSKQKLAPAKVKEEGLRRELLERTKEEQELRLKWIELEAKTGADPQSIKKEIDLTLTKLTEIDARNRARMKEIVDRYGWPGKSLVGADGSNAAWLLVQHADPDHPFQKRCLGLLAEAVKKGDASPQHLAYLTDRVRVAEKAKQVYGTQFHEVDGKQQPFPIEDEANVDKRRKEVGLQTLAEYRKSIEATYKPQTKTDLHK